MPGVNRRCGGWVGVRCPDPGDWGYLLYGGSVLADESLGAMTDFAYGYGLGAADYRLRFGIPAVGHDGDVPGYATQLVAFPKEGVVVAVLINTNRQSRDVATIAGRLRESLSSGSDDD